LKELLDYFLKLLLSFLYHHILPLELNHYHLQHQHHRLLLLREKMNLDNLFHLYYLEVDLLEEYFLLHQLDPILRHRQNLQR
jgi:hypothetical protein